MVSIHKFCDFSSKVYHEDKENKYRYHKSSSIFLCPVSKCRVVTPEKFCLKYSKSSNYDDEKECKNTWFRNPEYCWFYDFCKALFEHIECSKEDDKESKPLNRGIFFEHICYPSWCNDHENNRKYQTYHEVYHISMTCSRNSEDIIEGHSYISDDDSLDCCRERICFFSMFIMVFVSANFSIKFPYNIEEKYRSEEFESRNFHEPNSTKRENNSQNSRSCNSPKYCLFSCSSREFLCCHAYENGIVTAHNEIDEYNIEKCKNTCSCK